MRVESVTLHQDEPLPFTQDQLAQFNQLTAELQTHLNKQNRLALGIQTFAENVNEVMDVQGDGTLTVWYLRAHQRIVGYLLTYDDRHPVIGQLVVDKRYRGQGLGLKLLQSVRAARRSFALKVLVLKTDRKAVTFYQKCGGFIDFDHLSRFTHLIIFPPFTLTGGVNALSRESEMGTDDHRLDH